MTKTLKRETRNNTNIQISARLLEQSKAEKQLRGQRLSPISINNKYNQA